MTEKKISLTFANRPEAGSHDYDIIVGHDLLPQLDKFIDIKRMKGAALPLLIDENFFKHHGAKTVAAIKKLFPNKNIVTIPVASGEGSKSLKNYSALMEQLLSLKLERQSWLIAIGGGVVGDLAGFCAATLLRGIEFIQIPTTLLAMVDSSVGGKTGINATAGKNLIGAFHQPSLVLADIEFLKTLPRAEISAGTAEIIKYAAIMDSAFFTWLEQNMEKLIELDDAVVATAIEASVKMKADVVAKDEKESSWRMILNFGHTFAHAIEAEYQYKPLSAGGVLHGQAVGFGMLLAARFSEKVRQAKNISQRLEALLRRANLPTSFNDMPLHTWQVGQLLHHMRRDKKVSDEKLVFILLEEIGKVVIDKTVPQELVIDFLTTELLRK